MEPTRCWCRRFRACKRRIQGPTSPPARVRNPMCWWGRRILRLPDRALPGCAEASKVVKLIKNMSSVLQWQLMEELKASSDHLDVALAEVAKFPPDGAEA